MYVHSYVPPHKLMREDSMVWFKHILFITRHDKGSRRAESGLVVHWLVLDLVMCKMRKDMSFVTPDVLTDQVLLTTFNSIFRHHHHIRLCTYETKTNTV